MPDIVVVMGCFGLKNDDFISCNGIENIILEANTSLYKYNEIMDYFDVCRLFDKPLLEFNAIRHFIHNIHDRFDQVIKPIWLPKKFELYQKFVINHRHCGLYIKLATLEDKYEKSSNTPDNKLRLVYGRK